MTKWTEKDVQILKDNYIYGDIKNIIILLNNKFSYKSICSKAKKLNISCRKYWSQEEINILKQNYPFLPPDEMVLLLPNRNKKTLIMKACELGIKNIVSKNLWYSDFDIQFIIDNWQTMTDFEMAFKLSKTEFGIRDQRAKLGLSRFCGDSCYENLCDYVRRNNVEWKKLSMRSCNYKCIISKERFDDIHHLRGLNLILDEALLNLKLEKCNCIDKYSKEDLDLILCEFRKVQNQYPLGVCLTKSIHSSFHQKYGFGNNTIDQWNEFESNFKYNDCA